MIDILAILLALGLLMYLAFRGVTLLVLAPGMALLAALLTGGLPLLAAYTQIFMTNTGDFIIAFFPLFMLGAIFGKLMDDSGSARSIAARSPSPSASLRPRCGWRPIVTSSRPVKSNGTSVSCGTNASSRARARGSLHLVVRLVLLLHQLLPGRKPVLPGKVSVHKLPVRHPPRLRRDLLRLGERCVRGSRKRRHAIRDERQREADLQRRTRARVVQPPSALVGRRRPRLLVRIRGDG